MLDNAIGTKIARAGSYIRRKVFCCYMLLLLLMMMLLLVVVLVTLKWWWCIDDGGRGSVAMEMSLVVNILEEKAMLNVVVKR